MKNIVIVAILGWFAVVARAEWDATDALREYIRNRVSELKVTYKRLPSFDENNNYCGAVFATWERERG